MTSFSGNIHRDEAILNAVRMIVKEREQPSPALVDQINGLLPFWDPCTFDELQQAFAIIEREPEMEAACIACRPVDSPTAEGEQPSAPAEEAALDPDEARENLRLSHVALAEARAAVTTCTTLRNSARERLARAINQWTVGIPKLTPEQNARQFIAASQQQKQMRKEQGIPPAVKHPGPSYIDRVRAYSFGGDGADFARKQLVRGHRRFTRGDRMLPDGRIVRPAPQGE